MRDWCVRPLLVTLLCATACSGQIGGGSSGASDPAVPGAPPGAGGRRGEEPDAGATAAGQADAKGGPAATPGVVPAVPALPGSPTLRRLTVEQYQHSVRDIFGFVPAATLDLETDAALSGYISVGAAQVSLSAHATEQFETAAYLVAHEAMSAANRMAVAGCTPGGTVDDVCVRKVLTTLGRRAWRRPLTAAELTRYATVSSSAGMTLGDAWGGLEYAVAGLLQSPFFLYRVEMGVANPQDPRRRALSGYELASRMSYFLADTTPDDTLLDVAASGKLTDPPVLRIQAQRLLDSPHGHEALRSFVIEVLRLSELDDLKQLPSVYPLRTATVGAAMREETVRVFDDLVFTRDADYREIFTSPRTFLNKELAQLYGVPAPSGQDFVATMLPASGQRQGLLGQAAVLASTSHATATSPTRRGRLVREVLLCQTVPPPPPNVNTSLPEDTATGPRTMRQKLAGHDQIASCAACHTMMDPIGLGLENFDGLGGFRATDANQMIDASGVLDGTPFKDARDLGQALHDHPNVTGCLVRHFFRYALGYLEDDDQQPAIAGLLSAFSTSGNKLRQLMLAVVSHDVFRTAGALP